MQAANLAKRIKLATCSTCVTAYFIHALLVRVELFQDSQRNDNVIIPKRLDRVDVAQKNVRVDDEGFTSLRACCGLPA